MCQWRQSPEPGVRKPGSRGPSRGRKKDPPAALGGNQDRLTPDLNSCQGIHSYGFSHLPLE